MADAIVKKSPKHIVLKVIEIIFWPAFVILASAYSVYYLLKGIPLPTHIDFNVIYPLETINFWTYGLNLVIFYALVIFLPIWLRWRHRSRAMLISLLVISALLFLVITFAMFQAAVSPNYTSDIVS